MDVNDLLLNNYILSFTHTKSYFTIIENVFGKLEKTTDIIKSKPKSKYGETYQQLDIMIDLLNNINRNTSQLDEFLDKQRFKRRYKFSFVSFDQNRFSFYKHDYKNVVKFLEEEFFSTSYYIVAEVSNTVTSNLITWSKDIEVFDTLEEAKEYAISIPVEAWNTIIVHDGENTY